MILELLKPVEDLAVAHNTLLSEFSLGKKIKIHTKKNGLPELETAQIAILGVKEDRGAIDNAGTGKGLEKIRKHIYQLFPGNWFVEMVDLGNIEAGEKIEDTYFALKSILGELMKRNITPIIIGGSQDLSYAQYAAYESVAQGVNMVAIDHRFDMGLLEDRMHAQNFMHRIILDRPNNLFHYTNIGFQTYFNAQDQIELIEKLHFEAYRIGEVTPDLKILEPVFRDADMVSVDLGAVRMSEAPANMNATPNGFYGDEICALSRYAGISSKNKSFGIYEFNAKKDRDEQTAQLIAQMIWYFIEGYNYRIEEDPFTAKDAYQKYIVPIEEDTIVFYKSNRSERWWMEIMYYHNKIKKTTLIPCTYQDYLTANNQVFPERWLKTFRKLS